MLDKDENELMPLYHIFSAKLRGELREEVVIEQQTKKESELKSIVLNQLNWLIITRHGKDETSEYRKKLNK